MIVQGKIIEDRKNNRTKKMATLVEIGTKKEWFPKSCVTDNFDGTLTIDDWIYKKKFGN